MKTPEEKREILDRILGVWLAKPELRLGQLVETAAMVLHGKDLFYIEDDALLEALEGMVKP